MTSSTCGSGGSTTSCQTRAGYGSGTLPGHRRSSPRRPNPDLHRASGGGARTAPQLNVNALNIPLYNGLAYWESRTAPERGHHLRAMMERYAQTVGPEPHAEPPGRGTPTTVTMVVLGNGHYYQVGITPRRPERRSDLEAVDSMLPRDINLPDGPIPLVSGQPPGPLTAIISGRAGSWHPGHALYCLWQWAPWRWQHTKEWSATWRFQLDDQQHAKLIASHDWANPPTTDSLYPVFAILHIQAFGPGQV